MTRAAGAPGTCGRGYRVPDRPKVPTPRDPIRTADQQQRNEKENKR